jgi:uncharacterized protein (DUF885 family)
MPRALQLNRIFHAVRREIAPSGVCRLGCLLPSRAMKKPFLALATFLLTACSANPPLSPDAQLNALVEEYFDQELELNPMGATAIGDSRFDDRLDDSTSPGFREKILAIERAYLDRARRIDAVHLSPASRLTFDIFVDERELSLRGANFPEHLMPFNQMDGLPSQLVVYGSASGPQPFKTVSDYDRFLKRLREFPHWADGAIALMREGMARGVTVPRAAMAKVVPQLREVATANARDSLFWKPVAAMPDSFPATDRQRLSDAYAAAISNEISPAYQRLADFIERDYLPAARTTVGWSAMPDGAAWYRWRILGATTLDLPPEQIHALGLSEVARIRGEMMAVKDQVGFNGDLAAFFKFLQDDPQFYYTNAKDLLDGYRDIKRHVDGLLPKLFSDFPKADYEIREVEAFRAQTAAGGSYESPSSDGKRPGIFYVNTFNLRAQPRYGMETLSLHEAAPGHHFQIAIQQELKGLPRFRLYNGYVSYSEGWALYAESLGKELGVFTDPYQWYGRLSDEMLRAMRLVVDTGLHAKGWSREQAIRYMLDNSSMVESDVTAEVERYMVWPGQALGYKLGQIRIRELRNKAEQQLGGKFDVREFHSQVLRDGALPMDVLSAKIDRWIAAKKAAN